MSDYPRETVEIVARALCAAHGFDPDMTCDIHVLGDPDAGSSWAGFRKDAIAVLSAINGPSYWPFPSKYTTDEVSKPRQPGIYLCYGDKPMQFDGEAWLEFGLDVRLVGGDAPDEGEIGPRIWPLGEIDHHDVAIAARRVIEVLELPVKPEAWSRTTLTCVSLEDVVRAALSVVSPKLDRSVLKEVHELLWAEQGPRQALYYAPWARRRAEGSPPGDKDENPRPVGRGGVEVDQPDQPRSPLIDRRVQSRLRRNPAR